MRVGLFGDRIARGARATGVGGYITWLGRALASETSAHDLILFSTPEHQTIPSGHYGDLPYAYLPGRRRPLQLAWTVAKRPRLSRVGGEPVDLVHQLVPSTPLPVQVPLVVTIHDLSPLKFPGFFTWTDRALFQAAIKHAKRHAKKIITISETTRRDVVELLGVPEERVTVVYYGPPGDLVAPSDECIAELLRRRGLAGLPYVIFVGEVTARKNPVKLVEAFARASCVGPGSRLVFAGPLGLGADDVAQRIRDLHLSGQVELLGRVPRDELAALVKGAACLVLPSADEGFGVPALEGMTLGTPVVVSNGGALPEVVGEAGIVVDADPEQLAAAIALLLGSEERQKTLSELGRARAAQFSWTRAARETLAVYDEVYG